MIELYNYWKTVIDGKAAQKTNEDLKELLETFAYSALKEVYGLQSEWTPEQTNEFEQLKTLLESLIPSPDE